VEIKLKKPLELVPAAGDTPAKTIEVLSLDLEKLTGADVEFCARESAAVGRDPLVPLLLDQAFHAQIAARATGVSPEALRRLGAADYIAVITVVQGFLSSSG
jgi:hypothetical protein